jgi:hypothetical protein
MAMKIQRTIAILLAAFALCWTAAAQTSDSEEPPKVEPRANNPLQPPPKPEVPTISFDWVTIGEVPQEFSFTVDSTGRAAIEITAHSGRASTPEGAPFLGRFLMPERDREHLFRLASEAKFFNGNFDYTRSRIASTGVKTISYADPTRRYSTTYNWSENKAIQQLTNLLTGIYWTEYYGRRLQEQHHYDKLGLDETLRAMIDSEKRGELNQLQLVQPILQNIAEDGTVMNMARARARQLLQAIPADALPAGGSRAP